MKRFFTNLKTLAVVGVAALAVSCAEAYDDTDLRNEVAKLAERVQTLEDRWEEEVAALRALIDEKVALAEVKEDGAWQFTLSDGKTLTLYPEYAENGLTLITEGGVKYWAKVEGNVVTALTDAQGNKVAFNGAPQVQVNAEGVVEVSVDGGASWIATEAKSLISAIDVEENVANVTLHSGEVLKFALYEQVNFNVNGHALFVAPASSEKVTMTLDGIVEVLPLVVPNGWSVAVDGLVVTVTAPTEVEEVQQGGGIGPLSTEGSALGAASVAVKLLAVSKEGKSVVATLYVNASVSGAQSLKVIGENLVITNYATSTNWWGDVMPAALAIVAFPAGEYTVESFLAANQNYSFPYGTYYYEENGVQTVAVSEILASLCEVEKIERGAAYTFLAFDPNAWPLEATGVMRADYVATYANVELVNATFKDININVTVEGYNGYKLVVYNTKYDPMPEEDFGYWKLYDSPWGVDMTANYNGSIFALTQEIDILANQTYAVYLLPLSALKDAKDYTWEDVIGPMPFKTKSYTSGGMLQPTLGEAYDEWSGELLEANYQYFYAGVTGPEGSYRTLAHYYTAEQIANFSNEADLVSDLIANGLVITGKETRNLQPDSALNPGTTMTVAAVTVDMDGKYGPVVKKEYSTKSLEYSAVTIEFDAWNLVAPSRTMTTSDSSYTFSIKVNGGELANTYMSLTTMNDYTIPERIISQAAVDVVSDKLWGSYIPMENVAKNEDNLYAPAGSVKALPYKGGTYAPSKNVGLAYGKEYLLVIFGVDADGKPTNVISKQFDTFVPLTLVYQDDAKWAASRPTVTVGEKTTQVTYFEYLKEDWESMLGWYTEDELLAMGYTNPNNYKEETKNYPFRQDIVFTVTPGPGAVECILRYDDMGYTKSEISVRVWIDKMIGDPEAVPEGGLISQHMHYTFTEETTFVAQMVATNVDSHVYVTWRDADGNWYEATMDELNAANMPDELAGGGNPGIMKANK